MFCKGQIKSFLSRKIATFELCCNYVGVINGKVYKWILGFVGMIIDASLLREIDLKKAQVIANPDYWLKRDHHLRRAFASSARQYEWAVQHPEVKLRARGKSKSQDRGDCISALRDGVTNFERAWAFISHTDGFLDEEALLRVGALVDPERNEEGYRRERVSLGFSNYTPPNPAKVQEKIESALKEVGDRRLHPVERAAMAHLYLTGVQPFISGNKRVAKLFQDRLLYGAELPIAVIHSGERETYVDLLEQGLASWQDGTTGGRKIFYDFIGGKVNMALDDIRASLTNKRSNGNGK